jgi:PAS domain S-box-containing protein
MQLKWQLGYCMVWVMGTLACVGQERLTPLAHANPPLKLSITETSCLDGYPPKRLRVDPAWALSEFYGNAEIHKGIDWAAVRYTCTIAVLLAGVSAMAIVICQRRLRREAKEREWAERALQGSQAKYRMLFDSMLDGFALHEIVCDEQGQPVDYRFLDVNPSFERLTGLARETILGKTVLEVLPNTEAHWITTYGKVALQGESIRFENHARELDRHFEILAFGLPAGQFACIFQDITQRKGAELALQKACDEAEQRVTQRTTELLEANDRLQAEIEQRKQASEQLAQSDCRYRLLVESMTEGLGQVDAQGRITYVNPRLCQMLGYSAKELLGTDARRYFDAQNQAILAEQMARRRRQKQGPYEIEWTRKDGSKLCTLVSPRADYRQDEYVGSFGIVTDLTPLKKTEEALRLSEERFTKAFHNAPLLIGISRISDGTYLEVNRTFVEKTGYSYEEAVGKSSVELGLLDAQTRQRLKEALEKDGRIRDIEVSVQAKEGSGMDCLFAAEPIDLNGQTCLIAIVQDITQRKQAQAEILAHREKLRSLASRLSVTEECVRKKAATVLHDSIGQDLISCCLLLGAERRAQLAPDLDKTLGKVIELLEKVTEETKELTFDLASPTLYKLGLIPAMEEWLLETVQGRYKIEACLENHGIPDSLDETVSMTAFRSIREISFNAVKHAQAQRIEVHLEAADSQLLATVIDNGVGFDYERIEANAVQMGHFGLLSVRERLEYMGGQFQIESAPGQGTKVILTMPVSTDTPAHKRAKGTTDNANTYTFS